MNWTRRPAARLGAALAIILAVAGTSVTAASTASAAAGPPARASQHAGARTAPPGPLGGRELTLRGVVAGYLPHGPRLPKVPATAYLVADAGTGQVLAARNAHRWLRPASTLKVLTAIALMRVLKPDQEVATSHRAAIVEPSKAGLVQGNRYRAGDLFKALLMISANDAAIALVQATGSYQQGMALVNAEARHLQARDTVAVTPNGLDARGQHVSAYDEALFAREALKYPQFMRDEQLRTFRFPLYAHVSKKHKHRWVTLYNQNTMLDSYPGDLGGKLGWTTPAGATFIGWARRGGRTLVVTILHCKPLTEMTYAARLLNWGFAMDGKVRPVGTLVSPLPWRPAPSRPPAGPESGRRPRGAAPGLLPVPFAAGAGTLLLGLLAGAGIAMAFRRAQRLAAAAGAEWTPGRDSPDRDSPDRDSRDRGKPGHPAGDQPPAAP